MPVLVICKFDEDPIQIEGTIDRTRSNMGFFSTKGQLTLKRIVRSMGDFGCRGNQSFKLICSKTLCNLSPTHIILHIKFDQD